MSLTTRELLARLAQTVIIQPVVLHESKVVAAALRIVTNENFRTLPDVDVVALRKKLLQAAYRQNFSNFESRDWRRSPFALEGSGGLFEQPKYLAVYLEALQNSISPRILRGLSALYVKLFCTENPSTALLGAFLRQHVDSTGLAWRKTHEKYKLFHHDQTTAQLAKLLESVDSALLRGHAAVFQSAGLPSALNNSQLALAALKEALATLTHENTVLPDERTAQTIMALTSDGKEGLAMEGSSRLVEIMTDALLKPFQSSMPNAQIKQLVEQHLLRQLKDPRLDETKWFGVRLEVKEIILRWLTEQSLELFLKIVDQVANTSSDAKRMWERRSSFWRAYLKKNYIDEAWVVLGREGEEIARRFNASEKQVLSFGRLMKSTDVSKHIVLMLRIDSMTIVDWSHNGKCHIWTRRDSKAPRLYAQSYTKSELEQASELAFSHTASGTWQDDVSGAIYKQTGRSI